MNQFIWEFIKGLAPLYIALGVILLLSFIYYLIVNRDRLRHPEEYKDKGSTGEQLIYLSLKKYGITNQQILRNVYIPTPKGTTEIDLLVLSKKGILVFECKNYSGNIYGDGKRKKWVQYLGKKKFYFLNPIFQNRVHVNYLNSFLNIPDLPIIPFVATTTNGKWKVKNISPADHFLTHRGTLLDIYHPLPDSKIMVQYYQEIYQKLKPLERPNKEIRQKHINDLKHR